MYKEQRFEIATQKEYFQENVSIDFQQSLCCYMYQVWMKYLFKHTKHLLSKTFPLNTFLHIFFVVTNSLMHNLSLPNFFAITSNIFVRDLILLYFICALHSNTQVKSSLILIYGWPFSVMSVSYKVFMKKIFEIHMIMFCRRFHFYEFSSKMMLWMKWAMNM